jgi:hypothetical protein
VVAMMRTDNQRLQAEIAKITQRGASGAAVAAAVVEGEYGAALLAVTSQTVASFLDRLRDQIEQRHGLP